MEYLLDENLSKYLARILAIVYKPRVFHTMESLQFKGHSDLYWIPRAAQRTPKPLILTNDTRMRKNLQELQALKTAGLTVFIFKNLSNYQLAEQAWRLIRILPRVEEYAQEYPACIMEVNANTRNIQIKA